MSKHNEIDDIVFDSGGYPVGKHQMKVVVGKVLRQSNDLTEAMRHALMVEHHADWSMEVVAEAAYICSNVAQAAMRHDKGPGETPEIFKRYATGEEAKDVTA